MLVFGSGDGNIYCLDINTGKLNWKTKTAAAVLGAPLINGNVVYIGSSDHVFRKLNMDNGNELWNFSELEGGPSGR